MKKFNRLQLRRFKQEKLAHRKEEHRRLKKALHKAVFNIAAKSIGLELTPNSDENNPQGEINYLI